MIYLLHFGKSAHKDNVTKRTNCHWPPLCDEKALPRLEKLCEPESTLLNSGLCKMPGNGIHQMFVNGRWCAGGMETVYGSIKSSCAQHWNIEYSPDSECDNFLIVIKIFTSRSLIV